jgi:hypothetical protein
LPARESTVAYEVAFAGEKPRPESRDLLTNRRWVTRFYVQFCPEFGLGEMYTGLKPVSCAHPGVGLDGWSEFE